MVNSYTLPDEPSEKCWLKSTDGEIFERIESNRWRSDRNGIDRSWYGMFQFGTLVAYEPPKVYPIGSMLQSIVSPMISKDMWVAVKETEDGWREYLFDSKKDVWQRAKALSAEEAVINKGGYKEITQEHSWRNNMHCQQSPRMLNG